MLQSIALCKSEIQLVALKHWSIISGVTPILLVGGEHAQERHSCVYQPSPMPSKATYVYLARRHSRGRRRWSSLQDTIEATLLTGLAAPRLYHTNIQILATMNRSMIVEKAWLEMAKNSIVRRRRYKACILRRKYRT